MKLYEVTHSPSNFPTDFEWQSALEVEGILHTAKPMVLFSQYESLWLGAYGPVIKSMIYRHLCNNVLQLVDLTSWGLEPRPPQIGVAIKTFTLIGRTSLQRAILEVERRFCGNNHDYDTFSEQGLAHGEVSWTSREKASPFLDM